MKFHISYFQTNFNDWWPRFLLWNYPRTNLTGPHWSLINLGLGNDLVRHASYHYLNQDRGRHMASLGRNELTNACNRWTHLGLVAYIRVQNCTIIGSGNGLSSSLSDLTFTWEKFDHDRKISFRGMYIQMLWNVLGTLYLHSLQTTNISSMVPLSIKAAIGSP